MSALVQRVQQLLKVDAEAAAAVVRGVQAVGPAGWRCGYQADAVYRPVEVWAAVLSAVLGEAGGVVIVLLPGAEKAPIFVAAERVSVDAAPQVFTCGLQPVAERKAGALQGEFARCADRIRKHAAPLRPLLLKTDFRVPVTAYLLGYPCTFYGKGALRDVVLHTVTHATQRHSFSFSAPPAYDCSTSVYAGRKHLRLTAAPVPVTTALVL